MNLAIEFNPEVGSALKRELGDRDDEQYIKEIIHYCKKNLHIEDPMTLVPPLMVTTILH